MATREIMKDYIDSSYESIVLACKYESIRKMCETVFFLCVSQKKNISMHA